VYRLLTGGLGPPEIRAACLVGATKKAVLDALDVAAGEPAPFYLVYFAGPANRRGLRLADGYVDGPALGRHFEQVASRSVFVILDVQVGRVSDDEVAPAWARALAERRPGLRLSAARATRIGSGAEGEGHSRFTDAFLDALGSAEGDVDFAGARYLSDKRALEATGQTLSRRYGPTHIPVQLGSFGDFPLARCQTRAPLGSAKILGVARGKGVSALVRYMIEGRRGVPTRLQSSLLAPDDEVLGRGEVTIVPEDDRHIGKTRVRLPVEVVSEHTVWGSTLEGGEPVHLRFQISLRDTRGHQLDQKTFGHEVHELPKEG